MTKINNSGPKLFYIDPLNWRSNATYFTWGYLNSFTNSAKYNKSRPMAIPTERCPAYFTRTWHMYLLCQVEVWKGCYISINTTKCTFKMSMMEVSLKICCDQINQFADLPARAGSSSATMAKPGWCCIFWWRWSFQFKRSFMMNLIHCHDFYCYRATIIFMNVGSTWRQNPWWPWQFLYPYIDGAVVLCSMHAKLDSVIGLPRIPGKTSWSEIHLLWISVLIYQGVHCCTKVCYLGL